MQSSSPRVTADFYAVSRRRDVLRLSLPWQDESVKGRGLGMHCNYKSVNAVLKPAAPPHETMTVEVYLKHRTRTPDSAAAKLADWQLAAIRISPDLNPGMFACLCCLQAGSPSAALDALIGPSDLMHCNVSSQAAQTAMSGRPLRLGLAPTAAFALRSPTRRWASSAQVRCRAAPTAP